MEPGTLGLEGRDLTTAPTPPIVKIMDNRPNVEEDEDSKMVSDLLGVKDYSL